MRTKHHIKALTLTLALAATAASTAVAKPIPDPQPLLPAATHFVASPSPDAKDAARYVQVTTHFVASPSPDAKDAARYAQVAPRTGLQVSQPSPDAADVAANRYPGNGIIATTPAQQIVRVSDHSGFDWGDAGIGAAVALGLSVLAVACGMTGSRRRQRRIDASAPVVG